ncbi:excalibur calcium-binding domain-containing protein [Streptomyces sp. NBC_01142]|uniref:excalibur calcium-binding domain-containing protein n=1 Tax=Streptomyces sp. NBC_01142 TaxID=2975865 RepID=UPI00225C395F|nr:excalibur calcium-binding domain-containing protein [Streptomyces sp. NBC_01142]MCX4823367.1 excalibur calcium-binding domain-containing protein [Streptomyces sp. NBC_01142]
MSGRGSTHRNSTLAACAVVAVAVGLVGCGGTSSDSKSVAAASSPAVKKAVTPTPSPTPTPVLDLVDDDESADAGKPIVVDVLSNDTLTKAGSTAESVEAALDAGEFSLAVDVLPGHGTATVDGSTIVYTPSRGYGGADEFTYRLDAKGAEPLTGTAVVRITVAAPTPTPTPTPAKPKKPAPPRVSYTNCTAVRAAGAAPIHTGDPGYGPHLDRDGDGVACE